MITIHCRKTEGDLLLNTTRFSFLLLVVGMLSLLLVLSKPVAAAGPTSDEFIRGYAAATVQRDFQITADSLKVRNGVISIQGLEASDVIHDRIQTTLLAIEGVKRVVVTREGDGAVQSGLPEFTPKTGVFLPRDLLFGALLADPRWPHFSVSYQYHLRNDRLENVGSANFGETFSIYRFGGPWGSVLEVGLHAGVFSIFDLAAASHDLVNADYYVAIPLSLKKDNFSAMARLFHQSSHLGDEFLLGDRTEKRINLSYEGFDTLLAYNLPLGFRLYGGGGYFFGSDPSDLKPWIAQAGLEFSSHTAWWDGALRPIAAVDIQSREETDWRADLSLRAGVQFENPEFLSRKLKLLFEYYKGRSPNGQFFLRDEEEFIGIGLHFFL